MVHTKNELTHIQVHMFGGFAITIGGNTYSEEKGTSKRVWILVQYLLANRFISVPMEKLVRELWSDKSCTDPENALKNLVYRARNLLKEIGGTERGQFILFADGTYRWNNRYPCTVDTEKFSAQYAAAEKETEGEKRIRFIESAISLYAGTFLPKAEKCPWAVSAAAEYSRLYEKCVQKVCSYYLGMHRAQQAAEVCRTALRYLPYELSIHKILLSAYVAAGRREEALQHYTQTARLFHDKFSVDISASLRPYYENLVNFGGWVEMDMVTVRKDLRENTEPSGAYFCDYDAFRCICRTQARLIVRTGGSAFLLLFTVTDPQGKPLQPQKAQIAVEKMKSAIVCSLRRSDTVASYSAVQFIAMLPLADLNDAEVILERIMKKFRYEYRQGDAELSVNISPL